MIPGTENYSAEDWLALDNHDAFADLWAELVQYRKRKKLSREDIAKQMRISPQRVSQLEALANGGVAKTSSIVSYASQLGLRLSLEFSEATTLSASTQIACGVTGITGTVTSTSSISSPEPWHTGISHPITLNRAAS